jgi:hypothetical protein
MLRIEEGDGLQQVADNLYPHRPDQRCLIQEIFDSKTELRIGQTNTSAGGSDSFARMLGEGDANSILQSSNGTDFQLFDSGALNGPGADLTSSLLPKADALGPGGNIMDSIGRAMGDMVGAGMPMSLLSQLFQFLMSLFTEGLNQFGMQINQTAAAAASEAAKKLRI